MQDEDGNSPWKARHGTEFTGKMFAFGCGAHYLPAPTKGLNSKAAPTMPYGIFLGYRLAPGGRWNGQYLVAAIEDFTGMSLNKDEPETECYIHPHITEQVAYGVADICFPLKPKYDRVNLTFEA